ncbi:MAG: hypothetical protein V4555_11725 [Acidobacteriota bacterium]
MKMKPFQTRIPLLAIGTLTILPLTSCESSTQTIWRAQSKSPDGAYIALAHTENTDGPGINGQYTEVELEQSFKGARPLTILTLDEGSNAVKNLQMKWDDPSHLVVSYQGNPEVLFEAVKAFGLDVTVQHI